MSTNSKSTGTFELFGVSMAFRRLPALLATGILLGVAWIDLGAELNVPALFFHQSARLQAANGFWATLLIAYVWLVTLTVDLRLGPDPAGPSHASWLVQMLAWAGIAAAAVALQWLSNGFLRWLIAPLLLIALATELRFAVPFRSWLDRITEATIQRIAPLVPSLEGVVPEWGKIRTGLARTAAPFVLMLVCAAITRPALRWPSAVGALAAALLLHAIAWGLRFVAKRRGWRTSADLQTVSMRLAQGLFGLIGIVFLLLILIGSARIPPVLSVSLLLALIAGVNAAIWFHMQRWAPLGFGLLALVIILCNGQPYRLHFQGLGKAYAKPIALNDDAEPEIPELGFDSEKLVAEHQRVLRLCARLHQRLDPQPACEWERRLKVRDLDYRQLLEEYQSLLNQMEAREEQLLEDWRAAVEKATGDSKPKLVLVATSGGANRSSLWTAHVLKRLEAELPGRNVRPGESHFPKHIRLITGASGGMVGAAHYVATLTPAGHPAGFDADAVADDYLTPILNAAVFREAPMALCPTASFQGDRGQALETAMERTTAALAQPFVWFAPGEVEGWRPSLVFSPMLVEDGRRLIISNRMLPFLTHSEGSLLLGDQPRDARTLRSGANRLQEYLNAAGPPNSADQRVRQPRQRYHAGSPDHDVYSRSAIELFRLFPEAQASFRLSTAARMSASFPYVSPAVDLPTDPPRRVVDAGYYDNYGVNLAARWIDRHTIWIFKNTSGVVLIQIRDTPSEYRRRQLVDPDEPLLFNPIGGRNSLHFPAQLRLGWQWFTSPFSGAEAARWAISSFRNDELLEQIDKSLNAFNDVGAQPFFTTVVFERPGEVGMNWFLTEEDRKKILSAFDESGRPNPNQSALKRLKRWWDGEKPAERNPENLQFRP